MHSVSKHSRSAFTLIETVISLTIMSVLLLGLSSAMMIASKAIPTQTDLGRFDQDITDVMNKIRSELRRSSGIAYRSTAGGEQFTLDLKDTGIAGQTLLVRYRYYKDTQTIARMDTNIAETTILEGLDGFTIEFTQEDTSATLAKIVLADLDSIQTMFEYHIALPDKPEFK